MEYDQASVLICGGTAGIGLATAEAYLLSGVRRLMIVGRNSERGEAAARKLLLRHDRADIRFVPADVSTPDGAVRAADCCASEFGDIDILVSGAGGDPMPRLLHETPIADVPGIIGSITSGVLLPVRAVLPHMMRKRAGAIVCIASDAGKVATPGEVSIGAAMAAIIMFCRSLAIEGKRSGIRVNCITPSIVQDTPLYDVLMADAFAAKLFRKAEKLAQLGVVQPADIASLILYLTSPAAARLSGQTLSINGGISAA